MYIIKYLNFIVNVKIKKVAIILLLIGNDLTII